MILSPGFNLTLRPMKYPVFYEMYKNGIKNTWNVDEVDFSTDLVDLNQKLSPSEKHLIARLVAFFATGDSIVGNNLVLNLYKHVNSPEARLYLSRQLYEEALHVQFYLTLLDNYIPHPDERAKAFSAVENIPSISRSLVTSMINDFKAELAANQERDELISQLASRKPEAEGEVNPHAIKAANDIVEKARHSSSPLRI